jgi:hypothetical protein
MPSIGPGDKPDEEFNLPHDLSERLEAIGSYDEMAAQMRDFAKVVSSYYEALVNEGMAANHALLLVSEYQASWFGALFANMFTGLDEPSGEKADGAESEDR